MFEVAGGTQALQRTMIFVLTGVDGSQTRLGVPDALGALVLKVAAYIADARDRDRHLFDAALLAATMTDRGRELGRLKGTDAKRIRALRAALDDVRHPAWLALPDQYRLAGIDARYYSRLRECRDGCKGRPAIEHKTDGRHDCRAEACEPHVCRPPADSYIHRIHTVESGCFRRSGGPVRRALLGRPAR